MPLAFPTCLAAAHFRVLHSKVGKLFLQVGIQRKHAACPVLAGVDHGFQLKHRQSVLPPRIRQRWSAPNPRPPRCPASGAAYWCSTPSQHGQSRTSGRTSLPTFRPPASGRSHTPACSDWVNRQPDNLVQPLACQFQIGAAIGVEQLLFFKRQFHRLVPPYKKGSALCRPDVAKRPPCVVQGGLELRIGENPGVHQRKRRFWR